MTEIYLGLGSNLGDRLMNLASCLKELRLRSEIQLMKISSVYESEPYGFLNQPWFLNMVVEIAANLEPLKLLTVTQQIEKQLGRKKTHHWGPRTIDIDILSYNRLIFKHPMLKLPHQQLHLRQFFLLPLKEIAAFFIHPGFKVTIDQMLMNCKDKSRINRFIDGKELNA